MKRKYGDGSSWNRLIEKSYSVKHVQNGMLGTLQMKKVKEPSYKRYNHQKLCIANDNYTWLQYFINDKNFAITAMLNEKKELVQYYIDVAKEYKIDERGMPYFDDLYLDVVLLPNGNIYLLDEDELEGAYRAGDISKEEYDVAWSTAKWLIATIEKGKFSWITILKTEIQKIK
ncbi:ribonuclease FAU-1 family protein [Bacillus sp. C1]